MTSLSVLHVFILLNKVKSNHSYSVTVKIKHHAGLLGKLEHYGIDSKILLWITNFLNNRKQRVVVDGSFSNFADVESGVPQGTVLSPLLFLLHINDLPSCVNSKVRLFADDCLLYREIKNNQDQIDMQRDLDALTDWGSTWGMKFNAKKV